ncbi:MAG: D-inositol-3-phosphate glycosyltransferase [Candidatus Omnitrophica bacterium]|nr:D-inositol-3-phosphate glycosyltransferase [Candidatus Omnitrophota bacterium]
MNVALCHDWLNGLRGGEKCLEVLCELYPDSPVHTLFYEKGRISPIIESHRIVTSPLQSLPLSGMYYRHLLPLYPWAIGTFDLSGYDVVLSTSHCAAKGVTKPAGARHICYCFTPARYAWSLFEQYFGGQPGPLKRLTRRLLEDFRQWDLANSAEVDHFIAISDHVKQRIRRYYDREADVIYPPVDTEYYQPAAVRREAFYLVVSALVPYKRVDLVLERFAQDPRPLVIIGDGPERAALQRKAPPNVRFLGWQPDEILRDHYRRAKALIFPGEEDFGIVPVEAQACGCPVIAYGLGGAVETVLDGRTGVLFPDQTSVSLAEAMARFDDTAFDPYAIRKNAERFSRKRFASQIGSRVAELAGGGGTR